MPRRSKESVPSPLHDEPPDPTPHVSENATAADKEVEQHEEDIEDREAREYWGVMFKADKTGTDKLKALLRGLKDVMNERYEPSDNPDLTPNQLASFYRELHGNYDQLFLGTPSESIAFIYKSLGCLHSLQPLPHSTAFTDPTVPALKTEGWIMWQTIQLLLAPDEHCTFLIEAVQKWDIKDPVSGEMMPKILPRACFPRTPDKHMAAWYEGVSERLRKEAEDEERRKEEEAQQVDIRRTHAPVLDTDEEGSVDSKGPALRYFQDPLFRHVDGRPSVVRRTSKRPTLSPRPTMMDKGKGAASSVGHVIKNIGSPNLWAGRTSSKSRERGYRGDHRRRSVPENRFHGGPEEPPTSAGGHHHSHHSRHRSGQLEQRPGTASTGDGWSLDEGLPPPSQSPQSRYQRDEHDPSLRHSRSHEPTPSQKEYPDYFHGYYDNNNGSGSRRNSAAPASGTPPDNTNTGGFGPSASPLFATNYAKVPQPPPPPPPNLRPPAAMDPYAQPRPHPSVSRAQAQDHSRPYSRSPDPSNHSPHPHHRSDDRDRDRRYSSRERRPRFEASPGDIYDGPPPDRRTPPERRARFGPPPEDDDRRRRPRSRGHRHRGSEDDGNGREDYGRDEGYGERRRSRSQRVSGSEADEPRPGEGRARGGKQTRFAGGVDGRRYPEEVPWR